MSEPTLFDATAGRAMDVICLGRAGMDLYAYEQGMDFVRVTGFTKHVGGSPANIAIGLARLGMRAGFIGRVSNDMVGEYVHDELERHGVHTGGLGVDNSGTRTSLALTEMRPESCGVVIYRNNAADLALCTADIDSSYLGSARVLLVSGTALCVEPSRSATLHAMRVAREMLSGVVLDLDYRDYIWASADEAGRVYREALGLADVLIGNLEEFSVLDTMLDSAPPEGRSALVRSIGESYLQGHTHGVIVKDGANGSMACLADGSRLHQPAYAVSARKPFGAGDAFAAALLAGLLDGRGWAPSMRDAAAAAAIVVASGACGESTPTRDELEQFLLDVEAEDGSSDA